MLSAHFFRALQLLHAAGILLLLCLGAGWALAACTRWRALCTARRRKEEEDRWVNSKLSGKASSHIAGKIGETGSDKAGAGGSLHEEGAGTAEGGVSAGLGLPSVALVMPAKQLGEHVVANWRSQALTQYKGRVQCFIVVGSERDPAFAAAQRFQGLVRDEAEVHIVVAGPAKFCSQKIHNQVAGIEAAPKDTDYIFFLDDDVELTPSTITSFVMEVEQRPDTFLITGYPLDVPSGAIASFGMAAFHLPLSIVFSTNGPAPFVWGGCMFFKASDLRCDKHNVVSVLKAGGYSDDMTVTSVATAAGRLALCPGYALFLQRLPTRVDVCDVWRYLRRQLFTCMTYSSLHNFLNNQFVLWLHCGLSVALIVSFARSAAVLLASLAAFISKTLLQTAGSVSSERGVGLAFESTLSSFPTDHDRRVTFFHLLAFIFCASCLKAAQSWGLHLCSTLGGEDLASKKFRAMLQSTSIVRVWIGLLMLNAMYPLCALVTVIVPTINWSGITYRRRLGRVCVV